MPFPNLGPGPLDFHFPGRRRRHSAGLRRVSLAALFLCALGLLSPASPRADDKPMGATSRTANGTPGETPCVQDVETVIRHADGWKVTLRRVTASKGILTVRITLRNDSAPSGLLSLSADPAQKVVLVDESTSAEYLATRIDGIEKVVRQVNRDESVGVEFDFAMPETAKHYKFRSQWVTAAMQGTVRPFPVEFPVLVPDRKACDM